MVRIVPGFYYPPDAADVPSFPGLSGGLRVVVDGDPITRFTSETEDAVRTPDVYRATGEARDAPPAEFVGSDLEMSVGSIFHAFEPFLAGAADRHREYVARLYDEPAKLKLVLSHLDGDRIRVGALPGRFDQHAVIPVESQLGAAVEPADFATALADCFETCLAYVRNAFAGVERVDFGDDIADLEAEYGARIDRLRALERGTGR